MAMDYNWIEIFKEKSTEELYEIYCGKSFLPDSSIPFAKTELENRNFDFGDSAYFYNIRHFEDLSEEAAQINLYLLKNPKLSLKGALIVLIIMALPIFLFAWYYDVPAFYPVIIVLVGVFGYFIDSIISGIIRKKKIIRLKKIEQELETLISQQNQMNSNAENKLSLDEFDKNVQSKVRSDLKIGRNVAYIIAIILISILILKTFIK